MLSKQLKKADQLLFKLGTKIEILDKLKWSQSIKNNFLNSWQKGSPQLPVVKYEPVNYSKEKQLIKEILTLTKEKNYLAKFINETARSYRSAIEMIENRGKKKFTELSIELYGAPSDPIDEHKSGTTYQAATQLIKTYRQFKVEELTTPAALCVLSSVVKSDIQHIINKNFPHWKMKVSIDNKLTSKASANINRIRLRGDCCFAPHDIKQLLQHELFVHTLTLRNGRQQKLKSLGLNSPRITTTQEGMAVFSEFITTSIDINRLIRISSRVMGIQNALDGADFIEIFNFFMETGQSPDESYFSTARIFRGGSVKGGQVFTKDAVYLRGLIEVHNFFLKSFKNGKFDYPTYLFAGRMKVSDVAYLEPFFLLDLIKYPEYVPDWLKDSSLLLAFLLSSNVMNTLGLDRV